MPIMWSLQHNFARKAFIIGIWNIENFAKRCSRRGVFGACRHFFRLHDPTQLNRQGWDIGDNYRSAIFYFDNEQLQTAEQVRHEYEPRFGKPIVTQFAPAAKFYEAEKYHQKYTERTGRGMCHVPYEPIK